MRDRQELIEACMAVRRSLIKAAYDSGGGQHLGGALSMVEIMVSLYGEVLNLDPSTVESPARDRFILSKGHGVLGFYPVLHHFGYISDSVYASYKTPGSQLISHPIRNLRYGIESSNGSLGHGLSYAVGIAFGLRQRIEPANVYVLQGDGECNEGSVWEAAMSASQLGLKNITCIIDNNGFQSDGGTAEILDDRSLGSRWSSCGWEVKHIDGHSIDQIIQSLRTPMEAPRAIIAKTVKGKGVKFMENNNEWHHGRLTKETYDSARECLE